MKFQVLFTLSIGIIVSASDTGTPTTTTTTVEPSPDLKPNSTELNITVIYPTAREESPAIIKILLDVNNTSDNGTSEASEPSPAGSETIAIQLIPEPIIINDTAPVEAASTTTASTTEINLSASTEAKVDPTNNVTKSVRKDLPDLTQKLGLDVAMKPRELKTILKTFPAVTYESFSNDWKPTIHSSILSVRKNRNYFPGSIRPQQLTQKNTTEVQKTKETTYEGYQRRKTQEGNYAENKIMRNQSGNAFVVTNSIKIGTNLNNASSQYVYPAKFNETKINTLSTNHNMYDFVGQKEKSKLNSYNANNLQDQVNNQLQDQQSNSTVNHNSIQMRPRVKKHNPADKLDHQSATFEEQNLNEYQSAAYPGNVQTAWKPSTPYDDNRRTILKLGAAFLGYEAYKAHKALKTQNDHTHHELPELVRAYTYQDSQGLGSHGNSWNQLGAYNHGNSWNQGNAWNHQQKIVEVIKKVPVLVPYSVKVPVYKTIAVHVPKPYPVSVEKQVPVYVKIPVPYPVKVPFNVPYEVRVPVKVPHPVIHTVNKFVPYPVEVPKIIEKKIPVLVSDSDHEISGDSSTSFAGPQETHSYQQHQQPEFQQSDTSYSYQQLESPSYQKKGLTYQQNLKALELQHGYLHNGGFSKKSYQKKN